MQDERIVPSELSTAGDVTHYVKLLRSPSGRFEFEFNSKLGHALLRKVDYREYWTTRTSLSGSDNNSEMRFQPDGNFYIVALPRDVAT